MYEAISNTAEVVAAVLGIAVTVVAIIVELAATRFNHRITSMFAREPVNIGVLSFFVATTVLCVWVSATTSEGSATLLHGLTLAMVTAALLALLPYFAYVFSFISPLSIIARIQRQAERQLDACTSRHDADQQLQVARTVDELQDVLRSAIDGGDRDIAMRCIDALTELLTHYEALRARLPDSWHEASTQLRTDPDFVSLEDAAMARIADSSSWFEYKLVSQLHAAMDLVIPQLRDVANLIAIRTREIALGAAGRNQALLSLCLTGFNSYLRTTIRARDPRTAYYVLSQYRQTAEALFQQGEDRFGLDVVRRLQYYAGISFGAGQPFILEVCAYDITQLLQICLPGKPQHADPLLDALLDLDRPFRSEEQAATAAGVRRAQIRAAAVLLAAGDAERADRVIIDLANETQLSIAQLVDELETEEEAEYWELTPRGVNFAYLEPELRGQLERVRTRLATVRSSSAR